MSMKGQEHSNSGLDPIEPQRAAFVLEPRGWFATSIPGVDYSGKHPDGPLHLPGNAGIDFGTQPSRTQVSSAWDTSRQTSGHEKETQEPVATHERTRERPSRGVDFEGRERK